MKYLLLLAVVIISCHTKQSEVIPTGNLGLVPDDSTQVAKVPLMISKDLLKDKRTSMGGPLMRGRARKDRILPTVSISSPANGVSVTGVVNIFVTANDNVGVSSVSLSINGVNIGTKTYLPYSFTWNTTDLPNGVYVLTATARDAANNTASHSINVVKNVVVVEQPVDTLTAYELKTPPVGNQAREGSCVAFAVGYGAASIHQFYKTGATSYSYSTNIFSPEYLYNQTKFFPDCSSGTAMQTALDFIKLNGIVPWSVMPYEDAQCATMPTAEQKVLAQSYKINGYYKILTTDTSMIKSMIKQNKAVIISISVDGNFFNAKPGFIWKNTGSPFGIGHSIIIVGYNDQLKAWKIMNSFGTAWGTNGFGYIEYAMFPTRTGTYCYAIN